MMSTEQVETSHSNNHGAHSLQAGNLSRLFQRTAKTDIGRFAARYRLDFQLCGYQDTLDHLLMLASR